MKYKIQFKLYILQRLTLVSQFSIVQENQRFSAHTNKKIAPIRTRFARLVAYVVYTFVIYIV